MRRRADIAAAGMIAAAIAAVSVLAVATHPWAAEPLLIDLSDHRIEITTGFTGTEVLLFGAVEEAGDVVVVVRGPKETVPVWRKDRYAGIWMNDKVVEFEGVPGFYAVGSNRPLREIAAEPVLSQHQIGLEHLQLDAKGLSSNDALYVLFRNALVRNMQLAGLFAIDIDKVSFLGDRLFRAELFFPATVPTGGYLVEVFLLRGGQVISARQTPLFASKAGVSASVFAFAHRRPALHGIIAVLAALAAGLSAAYMFRKS